MSDDSRISCNKAIPSRGPRRRTALTTLTLATAWIGVAMTGFSAVGCGRPAAPASPPPGPVSAESVAQPSSAPQAQPPTAHPAQKDAPGPAKLVLSADGLTVSDPTTGLTWQREGPDAQTGCSGQNKPECTWDEANAYCASLSLGGVSGWRLPAYAELQGVASQPSQSPAAGSSPAAELSWRPAPYACSSGFNCVVLDKVFCSDNNMGNSYAVRCVH
jgi:hypothetical protein